MTLEKLLGCSASEMEAMSDAELNALLSPYFQTTRPAEAAKAAPKTTVTSSAAKVKLAAKQNKLAAAKLDPRWRALFPDEV